MKLRVLDLVKTTAHMVNQGNVGHVEKTVGEVCLKALFFCCGRTRVHTFLECIFEHF